MRFSIPSIIFADLLRNRGLLQWIQRSWFVICDWWILTHFVCFFVWRFDWRQQKMQSARLILNFNVRVLLTSTNNNQEHNYWTHHAAPTTDSAIANPIPREPHINGEVFSKNLKDGNTASLIFHRVYQGATKDSFTACPLGFSTVISLGRSG